MMRGISGKMLEYDNLQEVNEKKYKEFLPSLKQTFKFRDLVKIVEQCQTVEGTRPTKYFSKQLRKKVGELLGVDLNENPEVVAIYSAVGTVLDEQFGTDAFLRIRESGTPFNATITLDITAHAQTDKTKADLLVYFPNGSLDETKPDEKIDLDMIIEETAEKVKEVFERKRGNYFKTEPK